MNNPETDPKPENKPQLEAGGDCPSASCFALLDAALDLLAGWCDAVKNGGTGWDDWDDWYKDACYRPGPLRELIDARMAKIAADESECPRCHANRTYCDGWNCPTEGCDFLPNDPSQLTL